MKQAGSTSLHGTRVFENAMLRTEMVEERGG
jgi:hypothetical protein